MAKKEKPSIRLDLTWNGGGYGFEQRKRYEDTLGEILDKLWAENKQLRKEVDELKERLDTQNY